MADRNKVFGISLKVVNIFSICFLLLIDVNKTQVLWKKYFRKIQDFFLSFNVYTYIEKVATNYIKNHQK
jgi:hypothetical protein